MAVIDGKWLSKEGLTYVWSKIKAILIGPVDGGAKNILNLNTNFTSYTSKGITYKNNGDGTINVTDISKISAHIKGRKLLS